MASTPQVGLSPTMGRKMKAQKNLMDGANKSAEQSNRSKAEDESQSNAKHDSEKNSTEGKNHRVEQRKFQIPEGGNIRGDRAPSHSAQFCPRV